MSIRLQFISGLIGALLCAGGFVEITADIGLVSWPSWHIFDDDTPPMVLVRYSPGEAASEKLSHIFDSGPAHEWVDKNCLQFADKEIAFRKIVADTKSSDLRPEYRAAWDFALTQPVPSVIVAQGTNFRRLTTPISPEDALEQLRPYEARR